MSFSLYAERQSLDAIRQRTQITPDVGIILGSGLGNLARTIERATVIAYQDIPSFPKLTATGHAGELIVGYLESKPVVVMCGRAHLYEGHDPFQATYGVRMMRAMGAQILVASNAAGGLNPRFRVGDLVMLDSHIDLMHRTGLTAKESHSPRLCTPGTAAGGERWKFNAIDVPMRSGPVYDRALIETTSACANRLGVPLARGTYLATLGPTYETRAEYRAFRTLGADMVGMSTVPETILAASLGMKVVAFSVITNVATPDRVTTTSHDEVLLSANQAQSTLTSILRALMVEIA